MHRGKILHEATKVHPNSIKEIVEATGYKYGTFFKHIKTKDLSFSILAKYGKVMQRDFSREFPEMAHMTFVTDFQDNNIKLTIENLQSTLNELQLKYANVLEKHNAVIEELFKLKEENRELKNRIKG